MPFEQNQRLPLAIQFVSRMFGTQLDAGITNGFLEQISDDETWVYKRPGFSTVYSVTAGTGRGIYNWNNDIYFIVGSTLYKNGTSIGTVISTGSTFDFVGILGATPKLFLKNSDAAYTYDPAGGLVTVSTATNYPTSTVRGVAYLDGTIYVPKPAAGLLGSNINDATTWGALNIIQAQIEPDPIVYVGKQLVYVITFKSWSLEAFYDAGNPTGSPLNSAQNAKVNIGCATAASVVDIDGDFFWMSQTRTGSFAVYMIRNLKPQKISTPAVDRLLERATVSTIESFSCKSAGHTFYVLTSRSPTQISLVYDLSTGIWHTWTDPVGGYLPYMGSTFSSGQATLVLHESNGHVYTLLADSLVDDAVPYSLEVYTLNFDGGSRKKKMLHSMDIIADQLPGGQLYVRYSDDDYKTWSATRVVDLGLKRQRIYSLGTFRRRAFNLKYRGSGTLRIRAIDLTLIEGST